MLNVFMFLQNFLARSLRLGDRGATAVEYGLIVTLIAVAIILVVRAVGVGLTKAGRHRVTHGAPHVRQVNGTAGVREPPDD